MEQTLNFCLIEKLKSEIICYGRLLIQKGLVTGTGGNISLRVPQSELYLITPSGMNYDELEPSDIVTLHLLTGEVVAGERRPSIERLMHQRILQSFPEVHAVVHTHSKYATAVAATRKDLPPVTDNMVAYFYGGVRTAGYAPIGTEELAQNVADAMAADSKVKTCPETSSSTSTARVTSRPRPVALLANHGAVATGKNLREAFNLADLLEESALIYLQAMQAGGAVVLDEQEVLKELELLAGRYGQTGEKPK